MGQIADKTLGLLKAGPLTGLLLCASLGHALGQPSVLTYHNDNSRTGANLDETILTPANVSSPLFGLLFKQPVDGFVYAQPLYVPGVSIPNRGVHNVVYVVTERDSVYAFDADSNTGDNAQPLWHRSFRSLGAHPLPAFATRCDDLVPVFGITGTPVIDATTGTMYLVAITIERGKTVQRLHALDIATGNDKPDSPVTITASVPGTGGGSDGASLTFRPLRQNQRAALLLDQGVVYVAWGGHCDIPPYHGWIIGYDASSLAQVGVFNDTPDGRDGGIWQAGGGLAADAAGKIYAMTGNGTFDAYAQGRNVGSSFIQLTPGAGLSLTDYFTPFDYAYLDLEDLDVGSGGVMLLPDQVGPVPHLAIGAGKTGTIYLVNRDNMGHYRLTNNGQIVQSLPHAVERIFSTPAYWNGSVYFQGVGDTLTAFQLSSGLLSPTPTSRSSDIAGYPGATPSISANGQTNGIVWTIELDASEHAILHAHDAADVALELYNSSQAGHRDRIGPGVKFSVPTIANGNVYVGARRRLAVFGLLGNE